MISKALVLELTIMTLLFVNLSLRSGNEPKVAFRSGNVPATPTHVAETGYINDTINTGIDTVFWYDSTVLISISEGYQSNAWPSDPLISIGQSTDMIYGGYNLSIINAVKTWPGNIRFTNKGILYPNAVLDALGPANANSHFEMPNGEYEFTFVKGNLSDRYQVVIDNLSITIIPRNGLFTHSAHSVYWRRRQNSFALFCGSLVETSYLCDAIVDSLHVYLDLEEFFYPDTGIVGYGRSTMGHRYNAPARYFTYKDESDFKQTGVILEKFTKAQRDELHGVGISIVNWRQEKHMSWMMIR